MIDTNSLFDEKNCDLNDNDMFLLEKLDVIKQKIQHNELIGINISEFVGDEKTTNKIHEMAQNELEKLIKKRLHISEVDSEMIIISLSLIALMKYSGNFYNHVDEIYKRLYGEYSSQRIHGQIRNIINYHRTIKDDSDWRIVSLVLKHAIVPMFYLPSFFDFMSDIYNINFNHVLEDNNLYDEFNFIYDGLKDSMSTDNDELSLNVTRKTYQLIKSTKDIILCEEYRSSMCEFSEGIIKLIDSYYWDDENLVCDNEYLNYGFSEWIRKNQKKESIKRLTGEQRPEFISRWIPTFKLEGNNLFLETPVHKIKRIYNYADIAIQVSNDNEIIYENDKLELYEIVGGYRVKSSNILIEKPLNKLRYRITAGSETIYDSKEILWRNVIIFDHTGVEISNNTDHNGIVVLCYKNVAPERAKAFFNAENYKLGAINVTEEDMLTVDDVLVSFSKKLTPGVVGTKIPGFLSLGNNHIDIYQDIKYLIFETELELSEIGVKINGKRSKLTDLNVDGKKAGIYNSYVIELSLTDSNLYSVSAFNIQDDRNLERCTFEFVIVDKLEHNVKRQNKDNYQLDIVCGFPPYNISKWINIKDDNIFDFYISINNKKYKLNLPYKIPIFKINGGDWFSVEDYIWIGDIKTDVDIITNGFDYDCIEVVNEDNVVLTKIYSRKTGVFTSANIGALRAYKENHGFVVLNFMHESHLIGKLKCYNKCKINLNNTSMMYDPETKDFEATISYFGRGELVFSVYGYNDSLIHSESIEKSGDKVRIAKFPSFIPIKIIVSEKSEGFSINKTRVEAEWHVKYYSYEGLVGRFFKLHTVYFDFIVAKELERRPFKLHGTFVEIFERVDTEKFKGNIYTYKFNNKRYLDRINPVEIEILTDFIDGQVEVGLTNDEDGLLIDFDNKTILNSLEDPNAPDIFSCVISMERKKNYGKIKSD